MSSSIGGFETVFFSLDGMFSDGGKVLGMRMITKLYAKTGTTFAETPGPALDDYAKAAKQEFRKKPTD